VIPLLLRLKGLNLCKDYPLSVLTVNHKLRETQLSEAFFSTLQIINFCKLNKFTTEKTDLHSVSQLRYTISLEGLGKAGILHVITGANIIHLKSRRSWIHISFTSPDYLCENISFFNFLPHFANLVQVKSKIYNHYSDRCTENFLVPMRVISGSMT
jgi:hypothetical protein